MKIGTCVAKPGKMSFGFLEVMTHFDGTPERLPVVIAAGRHDGPCFWVTGNIHGDEYVGLLAVQGGVTRALADRLGDPAWHGGGAADAQPSWTAGGPPRSLLRSRDRS